MKRLQQAYVVRGLSKRTPEDPLTLPPDASFATTEIKTEPLIPYVAEPPRIEPLEVAAEPAKPPFVFENGPPPVNPSTPAPPERRFSSLDDDKPAMPEAPPAEQTYEDDSGPPLQL
jgi:hypothetical protein